MLEGVFLLASSKTMNTTQTQSPSTIVKEMNELAEEVHCRKNLQMRRLVLQWQRKDGRRSRQLRNAHARKLICLSQL